MTRGLVQAAVVALAIAGADAAVAVDDNSDDVVEVGAALDADAAVALALDDSPALEAVRLEHERERVGDSITLKPLRLRMQHQAVDGLFGNPYTDDGVAYGALDDTAVSVGWDLPSPEAFVSSLNNDSAEQLRGVELRAAQRRLAVEVRRLHARVLSLRAEKALVEDALVVATAIESAVAAKVELSHASSFDVNVAGLERVDVADDLERIDAERWREEERLASLLGINAPLPLLPSPARCHDISANVDDVMAAAIMSSATLQALAARHQQASLRSSLSWVRSLPYVDGFLVGYKNEPLDKRDAVQARVDIAIPIFDAVGGDASVDAIEVRRLEAKQQEAKRALRATVVGATSRLGGGAGPRRALSRARLAARPAERRRRQRRPRRRQRRRRPPRRGAGEGPQGEARRVAGGPSLRRGGHRGRCPHPWLTGDSRKVASFQFNRCHFRAFLVLPLDGPTMEHPEVQC